MKKIILGLFISGIFVGFILSKFDFISEFQKISTNISYDYIVPIILAQLMGLVVFSYRWRSLLEGKIQFKHAISSTFIGYAANMVLPARGGDLFRVYYCRNETSVAYFNLISKLFIEKVIDFIFVVVMGMVSFFIINFFSGDHSNISVYVISTSILFGMLFSLYLLRFQNEFLKKIAKKLFQLLKKESFFENHIESHITELETFLRFKKFIRLLILTAGSWIFYLTNYYLIGKTFGLNLSPIETSFFLFCGAMSLALPSAPSGVGVFHGAIISGFLVLKKDSAQGLVYATALHLSSFFIVTFVGLLFYLYWTYRRRHGFKKNNPQELN